MVESSRVGQQEFPQVRVFGEGDIPLENGCFGTKAGNLDLLVRSGELVPAGLAISTNILEWALRREEMYDEFQSYLRQRVNAATHVRRLLSKIDFTSYVDEVLLPQLQKNGLSQPFVVRSSSVFEDSIASSYAGIFQSYIKVESNEIGDAIRGTLTSGFSAIALEMIPDIDIRHMGIVVQEYIDAEYCGVCLSQNPVSLGSDNEFSIDICRKKGTRDQIKQVSLIVDPEQFSTKPVKSTDGSPSESMMSLAERVVRLTKNNSMRWNCPINIEWASKSASDEIYLLQVRPVKCEPASVKATPPVFDISDTTHIFPWVKDDLKRLVEERAAKKSIFRRLAATGGFRIPKQVIIKADNTTSERDDLPDYYFDIASSLGCEAIAVVINGLGLKHLFHAELRAYLLGALHHDADLSAIYVGEFVLADVCGTATRLSDGTTLIEYLPGGPSGLEKSAGPCSRVLLDASGVKLLEEIHPAWNSWHSPSGVVEPVEIPLSIEPAKLDSYCLNLLAKASESYSQIWPRCRLEWVQSGNETILWDITVDDRELSTAMVLSDVISAGYAVGPVRRLTAEDLAKLSSVLPDAHVVETLDFSSKYSSVEASLLRSELLGTGPRPVIVVEKPLISLVLLCGYVEGFVFEQCPLLCHLAILLREKDVPAVAAGSRFEYLSHAGSLRIDDKGVYALS